MKTSILIDHEPAAAGRVVRLLLRVEVDAVPDAERLPLNLSLVLDRSGSMHGEKLDAARDAAALLVRRLSPEDVVSVVAYDDTVTTVAAPARGAAQAHLPRMIERIETGGSTNLSGGWLRGRELVADNLLERGVNRVILLTDGLANVGITDPQRLTGLAAQGKRSGVGTTTIGFGEDYDEALLRALADAGGGNMYYIESADQAPAIFADELQGLLNLGAQNVAVTVRPAAAAQLTAVHHDYPGAAEAAALRLELGDLYAREPKPLLVQFLVPGDVTDPTSIAELVVAGDVLTADGGVERRTVTLPVVLAGGAGAHVEPEVRRELLLVSTARARRDALNRQAQGDHEGAAAALRTVHQALCAAPGGDEVIDEQAADIAALAETFAARRVSEADRKYMFQRAYLDSSGRGPRAAPIRRTRKPREEEPPSA